MEIKEVQSILTIGETVAVEFKRCGNGMKMIPMRQFAHF